MLMQRIMRAQVVARLVEWECFEAMRAQIVLAFVKKIDKPPSVVYVELDAIREGMRWCRNAD